MCDRNRDTKSCVCVCVYSDIKNKRTIKYHCKKRVFYAQDPSFV